MTVSEQLTAEEKSTLKMAAFGAVYLVSHADPGAFDMIKESFAASRALTAHTASQAPRSTVPASRASRSTTRR